jgi:hypothetical protein
VRRLGLGVLAGVQLFCLVLLLALALANLRLGHVGGVVACGVAALAAVFLLVRTIRRLRQPDRFRLRVRVTVPDGMSDADAQRIMQMAPPYREVTDLQGPTGPIYRHDQRQGSVPYSSNLDRDERRGPRVVER